MSIEEEDTNKITCTQDFLHQYFVTERVSIQFGLNNKTVKRINKDEFDKAVNCIMSWTNYPKPGLKRTASTYLLSNSFKKSATVSLPFILGDPVCMPKRVESNNNDTCLLYSDTLYDDPLIQRNDQAGDEIRPISSSSTAQILQSDYSALMYERQASNGSIFQFSSP